MKDLAGIALRPDKRKAGDLVSDHEDVPGSEHPNKSEQQVRRPQKQKQQKGGTSGGGKPKRRK